jgi:pre-mRNA-processing factor 19
VSLKEEDLIDLNTTKAAAPQIGSTIPSILQAAAIEFDRMTAEIFELRQDLQATRAELSNALHKGQGAVNTIARLVTENSDLT